MGLQTAAEYSGRRFALEWWMPKFIVVPPEKIAEVRKLYEGTDVPVRVGGR